MTSPSVLSSNCSRFWLNKDSDHKTKQQGRVRQHHKWMTACVVWWSHEEWGMMTHIKCDEATGQCVVACSSLSASLKLQPTLPFAGSNIQGNTLFVTSRGLLSVPYTENIRQVKIPLVQATEPHTSLYMCRALYQLSQDNSTHLCIFIPCWLIKTGTS